MSALSFARMGVWGYVLLVLLLAVGCSNAASTEWSPAELASEWERPTIEIPDGAIAVSPGESIQDVVDQAEPGAVLVLRSGVHRLQQVHPKRGQSILGEEGAILNGSTVLDTFRIEGDLWVHEGVELAGEERGNCRNSHPACGLPEDLFFDDERLDRVTDVADVGQDTWYLDRETGDLFVGRDPTDSIVEISSLPYAIGAESEQVTLQGLTIEKYASPAQQGVVAVGRDWTIVGCEIRNNHSVGIKTASGLTVKDSVLHHNGQFGMSGGGVGVTVEDNEIFANGIAGFSPGWAAGGTKFVQVTRLMVRNNFVHSNWGPGLWTDAGLENTTYKNNRVYNNEHAGIKHEISGSAVITGNEVRGNGFGHSVNLRGPGILIRESGPAEVRENLIAENRDTIVLLQDDDRRNVTGYELVGIVIAENDILFGDGQLALIGDLDESDIADVQVDNNRYFGSDSDEPFVILGRSRGLDAWRDATGDQSMILPAADFPS